jgi:hypothetical protein
VPHVAKRATQWNIRIPGSAGVPDIDEKAALGVIPDHRAVHHHIAVLAGIADAAERIIVNALAAVSSLT